MRTAFHGYAAADLLESFLRCVADFDGISPDWKSMAEPAKDGLARLGELRASPQLLAPLNQACLAGAVELLAQGARVQGMERLRQGAKLWRTLQMSLALIEPLAIARGRALIPASIDEAWSMIQAAHIDVGSAWDGGGSRQCLGAQAIRL